MYIVGMPAEGARMYLRFVYCIFIFYIDFGWFQTSFASSSVGWLIPLWIAAGTMWLIARIEASNSAFGGGRLVIMFPYGFVFYIHLILFGFLGKNTTARLIINFWLVLQCFYQYYLWIKHGEINMTSLNMHG